MVKSPYAERRIELQSELAEGKWNLASIDGHENLVGHYVRRDAPSYFLRDGEYFVEVLLDEFDGFAVMLWHDDYDYWEGTELDADAEVDEIIDAMDALWEQHAEEFEEAIEA